jgi:hypothetical protein
MYLNPLKLAELLSESVSISSTEKGNTEVATSTFAQKSPGENIQPNPLSPILGDEVFFTYMMPGAVFEAHDGSQWVITSYDWDARVEIQNRWYPRQVANVGTSDIRRSIAMWVDPVNIKVPPPLAVEYQ